MQQLSLSFQPGLSALNRSLREHIASRVHGAGNGLCVVAGKLDMAPSTLGQKLAGCSSDGKPRGITTDELEAYIAECKDLSPIYYLIDKYLSDPEVRREQALGQVTELLQQLPGLLAAAGIAQMRKR